MKITMLGTGNAMATACYNTCFAIDYDSRVFLVDAGGGNQIFTQLQKAGIDWRCIRDIFVTHKHIDHIIGVIWLIRLYCQEYIKGKYTEDVCIYAHEEVIAILRQMATMLLTEKQGKYIDDKIRMIAVQDGETVEILGCETTFFDIHSTKAKQFGFSMKLNHHEKLTCCGDEPYNEANRAYVQNSNWLLHEAFCLYAHRSIYNPYEKHHSTVKDACEVAQRLGVQNLLLYHTEDQNLSQRKALYTQEGRSYYSGNLFIPNDLESFDLTGPQ